MNTFLASILVFQVVTQTVTATAYTASVEECGKSDGITASGARAVEGVTIAADHIPIGAMVEIDGHLYRVQDRFGGGYTDRVDVYMDKREDAINFGRQTKEIKIYHWGNGES